MCLYLHGKVSVTGIKIAVENQEEGGRLVAGIKPEERSILCVGIKMCSEFSRLLSLSMGYLYMGATTYRPVFAE